ELRYQGEEICRIREEIRLASGKPNIRRILWQQAQVFGLEERVSAGVVSIQGEIQVFVVYAGEENGGLVWFQEKVPFLCEFEIPEADSSVVPYIVAEVKNISCSSGEDDDRESRVVLVEAGLSANIRLYEERKQEMLCDAYALDHELILKKDAVSCAGLRMKNTSVCRVNDTIQIEAQGSDILQICAGFGTVETDRRTRTADGIRMEGAVRIRILYLTSSDNSPIEAAEGVLPFQHTIEIPGLLPEDEVRLRCSVDALSFLMKGSREAEAQAAVSLQAMVVSAGETELIRGMEEIEFPVGERSTQPSMVGLTLTAKDTLWDVAKRYHTTIEQIRKTNRLESDTAVAGMKILVLKQLPEQL
ncbi:MAG: DUF3794 domain-containing protein, partial [Lachnospiraceae bacterium]|nr:DUF3794 domain-containing protein [Lachnospiraceae bacterium]